MTDDACLPAGRYYRRISGFAHIKHLRRQYLHKYPRDEVGYGADAKDDIVACT